MPNVPEPKIVPEEKPKIAFETPGQQTGTAQSSGVARIPLPNTSVREAIRGAVRSGGQGMTVGDDAESSIVLPTPHSSATPGNVGSKVQLLSDPMGVDFSPYLIKVLTAVRKNWYAVIPESARLGQGGQVIIQFAVNRDGSVPKLVISMPSGSEALDRAAVAGISASNPFPPLPSEFRGGQVRLQLSFKYKVAER
jgi:TonB family protein